MAPKVYLAGPINGCSDKECRTWRQQVVDLLGEERCLDPMRRDYRGVEAQATDEIVEGDKQDIDACDALIVYYTKPSAGTSMEILYAWERAKKIVLVNASGCDTISPWLTYHSTRVVMTLEEAFKTLNDTL